MKIWDDIGWYGGWAGMGLSGDCTGWLGDGMGMVWGWSGDGQGMVWGWLWDAMGCYGMLSDVILLKGLNV